MTKTVKRLNVGDIILTSTFDKYRPMLVLKLTDNFAYGVPLSTKEGEFAFTNEGLNNCRFLDPKYPIQYIHPIIHRIGVDWGVKNWVGLLHPYSVVKIRNRVKEVLSTNIL